MSPFISILHLLVTAFCAGENNKIDIIWQTQRDVSHVFVSEAPDHVSSDGGNHV